MELKENIKNERIVISLNTPSDLVRIKRIKKKLYELKFVHNGVLHVIKENISRYDTENNSIEFDVSSNRDAFLLLHKQGVGYFTYDALPVSPEEAEAVIKALAKEELLTYVSNPYGVSEEFVSDNTVSSQPIVEETEEETVSSIEQPNNVVCEKPSVQQSKPTKPTNLKEVSKNVAKVGFIAVTGWLVYRTIKFIASDE